MMKNVLTYIFLLTIGSVFAQPRYHEDLSKERLTFEKVDLLAEDTLSFSDSLVTPTHQQNAKADEVVNGLRDYYDQVELVKGKRILIYSGDSEQKADQLKQELTQVLDELYGIDHGIYYDKDWSSPSWRVVVGCFKDKLDAYRVYVKIKEIFPRALIIPDNRISKDCIQ